MADVDIALYMLTTLSLDMGQEGAMLRCPQLADWLIAFVANITSDDGGGMSAAVRTLNVLALWARQSFSRLFALIASKPALLPTIADILGAAGEGKLDIRYRALAVEILAGFISVHRHDPECKAKLVGVLRDPIVRQSLCAAAGHYWPWYQDAAVSVQVWALMHVDAPLALLMAEELVTVMDALPAPAAAAAAAIAAGSSFNLGVGGTGGFARLGPKAAAVVLSSCEGNLPLMVARPLVTRLAWLIAGTEAAVAMRRAGPLLAAGVMADLCNHEVTRRAALPLLVAMASGRTPGPSPNATAPSVKVDTTPSFPLLAFVGDSPF